MDQQEKIQSLERQRQALIEILESKGISKRKSLTAVYRAMEKRPLRDWTDLTKELDEFMLQTWSGDAPKEGETVMVNKPPTVDEEAARLRKEWWEGVWNKFRALGRKLKYVWREWGDVFLNLVLAAVMISVCVSILWFVFWLIERAELRETYARRLAREALVKNESIIREKHGVRFEVVYTEHPDKGESAVCYWGSNEHIETNEFPQEE